MPESFGKRIYLVLFGLIFLSILILTVHFREGENGVLHRSQRFVMAATSPLQALVTRALSPVGDGWDYLVHFGQLKRDNRRLEQEVANLKGEVRELQSIRIENERLRSLAGLKRRAGIQSIAARVIGMPESNWWSSIVVDRGRDDGVGPNMPVIAGGGLVGQVADVSARSARVVLLNDVQSGVSVQVQRTGEVGVIKGQLKDKKLVLQYISRDSTIKKGDVVVTSGLGGIFPKGLFVGTVDEVNDSTYSLYKTLEVVPPVDFLTLTDVLIVEHVNAGAFKAGN